MPEVLDPCCGGRMFYRDKKNPHVVYGDCRREAHVLCDGRTLEINPDVLLDFRALPYADATCNLIIFDPPHLRWAGKKSWMGKKYGILGRGWKDDLSAGFSECWRVLKPGGTLIFKWNETQIPLRDVLACFSEKPLCGQTTTKNLKTMWLVFYKREMDAGGAGVNL